MKKLALQEIQKKLFLILFFINSAIYKIGFSLLMH